MLNRMNEYRAKSGLTMTQLSLKTGISERYLYFIEKGEKNPSLRTACSIAHALNTSVDEIFLSNNSINNSN